jgi:hypothetical protein
LHPASTERRQAGGAAGLRRHLGMGKKSLVRLFDGVPEDDVRAVLTHS